MHRTAIMLLLAFLTYVLFTDDNAAAVYYLLHKLLLIFVFFIASGVKIPRIKSKVKIEKESWSGHSSSLEKLSCNKMELKRWIVIDMRWKWKLGSQLIVFVYLYYYYYEFYYDYLMRFNTF